MVTWEEIRNNIQSIPPEEKQALSDLARFASEGLVTDEQVEEAIESETHVQLRDRIQKRLVYGE